VAERKRRSTSTEVATVPIDERVRMVTWFKSQIQEIESNANERIERLRTVGEHPSPVFAQLVQHHAGMGLEPALIAKMLLIPYGTLMLHYEEDIAIGGAAVNLKIAENMARIATSTTDPNAAKVGMAWLERRAGEAFRPTKKLEIDDKRDKAPIIDSSKLSAEDRQKLREVIEAALAQQSDDAPDDDEEGPALIEAPSG
jgi:hypothetical protein